MSFDLTQLAVLYSFLKYDMASLSHYLNAMSYASVKTQPLELRNSKKNYWLLLPPPHHCRQNLENIKLKNHVVKTKTKTQIKHQIV